MTAMPPLRDILNNTPVNAIDVNYNFDAIEAHVGSEMINRDGSVAMTGALTLSGPPTAPAQAATKAYVDSYTPVGSITMFAAAAAPPGWVLCDGSTKSTTDPLYVALFAVIGYTYGGSGGNFILPDLRARFPVGLSAGDALFGALNGKGGNRDAIVPLHNHTQNAHSHGASASSTDINHTHDLQNHTHSLLGHTHTTALADGFDINSASQAGGTNAVYQPGGGQVAFVTRPSAALYQDVGGATFGTGGPTPDTTGGPAPNGSGWMNQSNPHSHTVTTDAQTPAINNAGVAAANANVPPFIAINFIIRIG